MSFLRSQVAQQSKSCMSRCHAIHGVVHAIILQQHQQLIQGTSSQPQQQQQQQQQQDQGYIQPQQQLDQGWIEAIGTWVIQTLSEMCDVHVPPYCYTTISPSSDVATGMSGY
ncbi:hypothetical protein ZWY2020_005783 [Hordeum vulgare]|nr:hypothetical protein ZWY2020_005783 [Hordeum vulgare]